MRSPASTLRALLFATVGMAALFLTSARPTRADDKPAATGAFFGTFEGHYLDNFGETTRWGTALSVPTVNFDVMPKWGGGGRVGLGYRADAGWDVVALGAADWLYSGQQQALVPSSVPFISTLAPGGGILGTTPATADAQLAYSYVDLEGGYNVKLGTVFGARLFGGVRYANFDQAIQTTQTTLFSFSLAQFDARREVSYWGVGPRVGASGRLRICESPFYLVSSVSGSALFGDMRVRESGSLSAGAALNAFSPQNTQYTARTAYNGEGEMGVLYDISPILQGLDVTVGYRVSGWFGVNDTRPTNLAFSSGESHANVVTQGTFLRLNVRY